MVDPVIIDPRMMDALDRYMALDIDDVSCLIAKFLSLYLTDSPYLEPYEVDNFILRNGRFLARWCVAIFDNILIAHQSFDSAWQLYDIQRVELSSIRTTFLLRTMVVDAQPLQTLIYDWFLPHGNWERRCISTNHYDVIY
jgi:hypothetical protein